VCKDAVGWSKCRAQFSQLHEHSSAFCPPIKRTNEWFVQCFGYSDGRFPQMVGNGQTFDSRIGLKRRNQRLIQGIIIRLPTLLRAKMT
jgi:hypothetical protein